MIFAPGDAHELRRVLVGRYEHERFGVLFLDSRHRLIAAEAMFNGTIDGAILYPRVVVKRALELNAAAVILTQRHQVAAVSWTGRSGLACGRSDSNGECPISGVNDPR